VVSKLEEYTVREEFILHGIHLREFFEGSGINYIFQGYVNLDNNGYIVYKVDLTEEDVLCIHLKFPKIILRKISNIS
jgi:hypothetical protein